MKRFCTAALSLLLFACSGGAGKSASSTAAPQTEDDKTLYALGMYLARPAQVFDLNERETDLVIQGVRDQLAGKKTDISLETYGPKLQQLAQQRAARRAEKEKTAGAAFADKAAHEAGAEKLPSGVVVRITQPGTGETPKATDTVKVHYEGTLENGTVFDSSKKRNEPATFALNRVIPCWTEGLQKLKVGAKATLVCPAATAYGDRGTPGIPAGATLKFEVELLGIEPPGAGAPGAAAAPAQSTPASKPPAPAKKK
jgi:FKBP-type peptidyl-prolyl cis-trans isomerase FkpA